MDWIIPASYKTYDVEQAFANLKCIDWKQNANYSIGDKVYIYCSKPSSSIEFLVEVVDVNICFGQSIDDEQFWKDANEYRNRATNGKYVRFKLIKHFTKNKITLQKLREHGLKGNIQGPRQMIDNNNQNHSWAEFILSHIEKDDKNSAFWRSFEKKAFENEKFVLAFNKSKTHNKSYYDLTWNNGALHLVVRNTKNYKRLEVYINDSPDIYDYFLSNIELLEKNLEIKLSLNDEINVEKQVHRKFILNYIESGNETFFDWIVENALKLKENIEVLLGKKSSDEQKETDEKLEDYKLNEFIQKDLNKRNEAFSYTLKAVALPEFRLNNKEAIIYKRDQQKSLNALSHACYKCEYDESHLLFERKSSNIPYTEAHHLIPMAFQEQFKVSLDVEENIVSLCSGCHNEIHYGKHADRLIKKLYEERKKYLEKVEININLEKLLSFYGFDE